MIAPVITPDIAREMQAKGVLARKRNKELRELAAIGATVTNVKPVIDPSADELAHAQAELLAELRETPLAKDKAALSQAIKNLRETWHMQTGQPKPGTIKPVSQRPRQQSRDLPDAPDTQ